MISSKDICDYLSLEGYEYCYIGGEFEIKTFCSLDNPKRDAISWIKSGKEINLCDMNESHRMLFVVDRQDKHIYNSKQHLITCNNPKEIYFAILKHFFCKIEIAKIQHDSVIKTQQIGEGTSIGHHCYIEKDVVIGKNVVIKNNVSVECPAIIGDNCIISSGVVIGTTGFGYYQKQNKEYDSVPHFGGVRIGKNVEIGANTCIDRGTLDDTVIGDNVKIDNLCHIAHNAQIEENAMIVALSLLGGSSKIRKNAYIAPGAIIKNQIEVGQNVIVGMGAVVTKTVEENLVIAGVPAKEIAFSGKL